MSSTLSAEPSTEGFCAHAMLTGTADPYATLHTIKGQEVHGLIVDPGAAEGLLGTETLLSR
eukprot:8829857-Pyramimonas_sp.AAC.1